MSSQAVMTLGSRIPKNPEVIRSIEGASPVGKVLQTFKAKYKVVDSVSMLCTTSVVSVSTARSPHLRPGKLSASEEWSQ